MPLIGMAGSTVMRLPAFSALKLAVEREFEAFEIFGDFPQCSCADVTGSQRKDARRLAESSGMALALHAPFSSVNIAALNSGIRAESIKQYMDAVDLLADLGGRVVVVHNGSYILPRFDEDKAPEAFKIQWDMNVDSLKKVAARAEERGVMLCLENVGFEPDLIDDSVEHMLKIREQVGFESMRFCIDIGHARLNNELDLAIEKMGPYAGHVHFTDNFGERDDHLIIGEGNFDYSPILDFIKSFDGIVTLEVIKVGVDPSPAEISRERVKKILAESR